MPIDRFFLEDPLLKQSTVSLTEKELHHFRVMRIKENEEIDIVNGQGILAKGVVRSISRDHIAVTIVEREETLPLFPSITLIQAFCRPQNLEYIIEKATELGATHFSLFAGDLSEKKTLSPSLLLRLEAILIATIKQCGSLFLPRLSLHSELPTLGENSYYGDLSPHACPVSFVSRDRPLFFVIGPEKGFSKREENLLAKQAQGIRLNPHILRAETAGPAAIAILRSL